MSSGDEGALPVLEAILVALIVMAAILFVSNVQRPLAGHEEGGVDLGVLASQTLSLLASHNFTDAGGGTLGFEEWVNATMDGDAATVALGHDYLVQVLPPGTKYVLLLSNGYGTARLAPGSDPGDPRNARTAEIPFMPHWTEFKSNGSAAVNATWAAPGQDVASGHPVLGTFTDPASTVLCLKAPDGSSVGPQGGGWVTRWKDGDRRVPEEAPFGVWAGYTDAGCTAGATYGRVALRSGLVTDYPIYGVRLVVWFGA